jgi:hypothetical protein
MYLETITLLINIFGKVNDCELGSEGVNWLQQFDFVIILMKLKLP